MSTTEDLDKQSLEESVPTVYVIDHCLIVPLPGVSKFYYANYVAHVVEAIHEFTFYLSPTINGLRDKVDILVKCNVLNGSNKLFHQSVSFRASITACSNEVRDVLLGISLAIKLLKLR